MYCCCWEAWSHCVSNFFSYFIYFISGKFWSFPFALMFLYFTIVCQDLFFSCLLRGCFIYWGRMGCSDLRSMNNPFIAYTENKNFTHRSDKDVNNLNRKQRFLFVWKDSMESMLDKSSSYRMIIASFTIVIGNQISTYSRTDKL